MLTSYNQYYCAWFAPNYIYLQFQKHRPTLEHDVGNLNTSGVSFITDMEPNSVSTPIMLMKTVGLLMFDVEANTVNRFKNKLDKNFSSQDLL